MHDEPHSQNSFQSLKHLAVPWVASRTCVVVYSVGRHVDCVEWLVVRNVSA